MWNFRSAFSVAPGRISGPVFASFLGVRRLAFFFVFLSFSRPVRADDSSLLVRLWHACEHRFHSIAPMDITELATNRISELTGLGGDQLRAAVLNVKSAYDQMATARSRSRFANILRSTEMKHAEHHDEEARLLIALAHASQGSKEIFSKLGKRFSERWLKVRTVEEILEVAAKDFRHKEIVNTTDKKNARQARARYNSIYGKQVFERIQKRISVDKIGFDVNGFITLNGRGLIGRQTSVATNENGVTVSVVQFSSSSPLAAHFVQPPPGTDHMIRELRYLNDYVSDVEVIEAVEDFVYLTLDKVSQPKIVRTRPINHLGRGHLGSPALSRGAREISAARTYVVPGKPGQSIVDSLRTWSVLQMAVLKEMAETADPAVDFTKEVSGSGINIALPDAIRGWLANVIKDPKLLNREGRLAVSNGEDISRVNIRRLNELMANRIAAVLRDTPFDSLPFGKLKRVRILMTEQGQILNFGAVAGDFRLSSDDRITDMWVIQDDSGQPMISVDHVVNADAALELAVGAFSGRVQNLIRSH